ncbi:MAG: hypothetical protein JWO78_136 [Micavibrio sp.]|nr:hypothetical protein [Micavibrio sp.]
MPIENQHLDTGKFELWTPEAKGIVAAQPDVDDHILRAYHDHFVRADYMESGIPGLILPGGPDPEEFSKHADCDWTYQISTFLIKEAGSNIYTLPSECRNFHPTIKFFAEDQHARSPLAQFKYATLTARHYFVHAGRPQVADLWHVDDTQEAELRIRQSKEFPISRALSVQAYIRSDHTGTHLQSQPVSGAMRIFNNRADERDRKLQQKFTRIAGPNESTLISNYTNHKPGRVAVSGLRSFVGVVYSSTKPMESMLSRVSQPLVFKSSLAF